MMKLFRYICAALIATSCVLPEDMHEEYSGADETVEVTLSLGLEAYAGTEGGEPITKAGPQIKNLWIVQYDGEDDEAVVVGVPQYLEDVEDEIRLNLVASAGNSFLFFLANTSDETMSFPVGSTIADLKKRSVTVTDSESLLASDGDMVFVGLWTGVVEEGRDIICNLIRNIAKATVKIVPAEGITIQSWQIRSVPSMSYYYTNFSSEDEFPSLTGVSVIDYPLQSWTALPVEIYLPVNQRGVLSGITSQAYKNYYAPEGATYLFVNAVCDGSPVEYSFYLGENFTTDFNISPNHSYSFTINISDVGDPRNDTRVAYPELVDYSDSGDEIANCYIINPGETANVRYRIPVKRVDEFWGGKNGYEDVPEYTLGIENPWQVEILTTNFDNTESNLVLTKFTGTGCYNVETSDMEYFELAVKPGTVGSAIVAIRRTDVGDDAPILWSWHLWITDYVPDEAYRKAPLQGQYAYRVTGGFVHRYEGDLWNGGYARRFIMDRNLGAMGNRHFPESGYGDGSLYFQFGRKDPMFGTKSYGYVNSRFPSADAADVHGVPGSIVYSIQNPLTYLTTPGWEAWSSDNKYNPDKYDGSIIWMDPKTSTRQYKTMAIEKSIFDPCPPGYCVPDAGTWSDFRPQSDTRPTTNAGTSNGIKSREFPDFDSQIRGAYYWPYPADGLADVIRQEELVYYPTLGIRQPGGSSSNVGSVYVLSANTSGKNSVRSMTITSETVSTPRGEIGMSMAQPVRCVTVRDVY